MTWTAAMALARLPDLPAPEVVRIVTNPGCAKFGVFFFPPLPLQVCDGPVLFPVLSLSGLVGLSGPGLVVGAISDTFRQPETWRMGREMDGSGSTLVSLRISSLIFH